MDNTYSYFSKALLRLKDLNEKGILLSFLLAAILIAIPLKYAFSSIATIVFIVVSFSSSKIRFSFNRKLLLPVVFYLLMLASLLWTRDSALTSKGLQKEVAFLFIPVAFLFASGLKNIKRDYIFKLYSFSMVFYAFFYFVKAFFRYLESGKLSVFFYHELVTQDLNAIYVSVFASLALFYFISLKAKRTVDKIALFVLTGLIFLLSSKSIITIDFLLIVCYYSFFSEVPKSVKATTIITIVLFLACSLTFVKEVKERFLLEYETAFVDNTVNSTIGGEGGKVYNISWRQAWKNDNFQPNHFFPGAALRIYQVRIFKEMLQDDNIMFTGVGLEASQDKIREKTKEYGLYPGYGEFNFHNQYIQTFSELGFFGFLIVCLMLLANLKNAWKNKDFLHIAFAVTMIILFLTESFFCRQRGVLFFIVLYCIFNAVTDHVEKEDYQKLKGI
ncbi:O-antigen ligase family protein [Flavobacterium pedocola]